MISDSPAPNRLPPTGLPPIVRLVRLGLVVLCVLLAVAVAKNFLDWQANRDSILVLLEEMKVEEANQTAMRDVSRERTPHQAKLLASRALVYQVMASGEKLADLAPEEKVRGLDEAGVLASEVLRAQPNSWQAAMLLGSSRYLKWALQQDRRLFTAADEWEIPLRRAVEVTGGKAEPRRMLAAAYLETWPALSKEKKDGVRELLRELFANDPNSLKGLVSRWLRASSNLKEAFEIIPDRPESWSYIESSFAKVNNWRAFVQAHHRHLDAIEVRLNSDLDEAAERLRLGDLHNSRKICLRVISSAPRSMRFVPLVVRAMEIYPPGLLGRRSEPLLDWMRWSLRLDSLALRPFSSPVVSRLTDSLSDLASPEAAHAAVLGDNGYEIDRAMEQLPLQPTGIWTPYLLAKSRWHIERKEFDEARQTLRIVDRGARSQLAYWLVRQQLAKNDGLEDLHIVEKNLQRFKLRNWNPSDWERHDGWHSQLLWPEAEVSGLSITMEKTAAVGDVVEVFWDGELAGVLPVDMHGSFGVALKVVPGPHLLEMRPLTGSGKIIPGRVSLWSR